MPALSMDSGLLDMTRFGINVCKSEDVKYRNKTTCNVLPLDGHTIVDRLKHWKDRYPPSRVIQPEEERTAFRYGAIRTTYQPEDAFVRSSVTGNVTKDYCNEVSEFQRFCHTFASDICHLQFYKDIMSLR